MNAITGAPLSQAWVSIKEDRDNGKTASLISSEDGHFEFSQLKAGKYSLEGAKRGFISSGYDQHEQFFTAIVTGPEYSTENLVLRLAPMAIISGHVYDESGEAVRNARVVLYIEDHGGGMSRINRLNTSTSDDRGYYDFSLLRPAQYYICVTAKPWYAIHPANATDTSASSATPISRSLDVVYPATYYNGATEADSATPIEVKGGDRLQIDVRLDPVPALHLVIRIPPDVPSQLIGIRLQKQVFDYVENVETGRNRQVEPGVVELSGVPPGRYRINVKTSDSGQAGQSGEFDLVRDGQELADSLGEPLGSLKVTLKMPGEDALPKQYAVGLQDSKRRRIVAVRQGDPSGKVSFEEVPPEKYAILISSPMKPYSVVQTSSEAVDTPGHYVNVTPGAAIDVTALLTSGSINIEGVAKEKGKPVAGVMVALVPKDPEAHAEFFRRDQSDFDGTFRLHGVFPGSYTVVAVKDAWGFEWFQPGVLARYVQHGQSVTISEQMRETVHLSDPIEVQPR